MTLKIKLIPVLMFSLLIGMKTVAAQKVVVKNGVEYLEKEDVSEDLSSIEAPSQTLHIKVKKKKNKKVISSATIESIKKVSQKRKTVLRFRKKRVVKSSKCYKETENNCKSMKKKAE
ncbi:hypothetical protein [uncultured Tenacibaculum sp.]|uniref:hypothetical protein n=1 Tax=uncultured Tenacibaculum sp. TaxID=174713 RepID=UPI00262D3FB6|nr:hypothetical protein [uncultured Tenacibaculum sp.]